MITAPFEYKRAGSVDEAISLLGELGEDAKLLAGGHSLVPLMKLRLAAPTTLIDIGGVDELKGVEPADGGVRIGALTRHVTLQESPELGIIAHAASQIADQQVRNRGTIGGSLAHGDPASDLPGVMLALEATFNVRGPERRAPDRGRRLLPRLPDHGAGAGRGDDLDRRPRRGRLELGIREVHPPRRGLGHGGRGRADQGHRAPQTTCGWGSTT